jgi:hypothetical protein
MVYSDTGWYVRPVANGFLDEPAVSNAHHQRTDDDGGGNAEEEYKCCCKKAQR